MTIQIGQQLPDVPLGESTSFGEACPVSPTMVSAAQAAKGKRVVIFGLPGAYTPTCSAKHVPGYVANLAALKAKGVDEVWCVSVNDGYVMAAWGKEQGALGKIRMLGDGNGDLHKAMGLDRDLSKSGMGLRAQRYAMVVKDGVVEKLWVEEPGKFEVSNAESVLAALG